MASGRRFGPEEDRARSRVAVLGPTVVRNLLGDIDPIGLRIRIGRVPFEVIGVLERKGFQFFTHMDIHDRMAFVPLVVGLVGKLARPRGLGLSLSLRNLVARQFLLPWSVRVPDGRKELVPV